MRISLRPRSATLLTFCILAIGLWLHLGCGTSWPSGLQAFIATDRYQLFRTNGNAQYATLHAVILEGRAPLSYVWTVIDPQGNAADDLLNSHTAAVVRFSAGQMDGPYQIYCEVTAANGYQHIAGLVLQVGGDLGLDITTERIGVPAGGGATGQATIHLNPQSGVPPYEVEWVCVGPDGNIDNERLDTTDPLAPVFTSSEQIGSYILTATIVDANGASIIHSVIVVVGQILGLDVVADRAAVLPGGGPDGMARLLATPIGGKAPYSYDWEIVDPGGTIRSDLLWDTRVRSPHFESDDTSGTFLARCAVTDADGTVLIGSTTITVGMQINVNLTADRLSLSTGTGSGSRAVLVADIRGGADPIEIEWQATGPDGADRTQLLTVVDARQVVFQAPAQSGPFIIRCFARDRDGVSAVDSLVLAVGGSLGLTVTADKTSIAEGGIAPSGVTRLQAQAYGGQPPYSYLWLVQDPNGNMVPDRIDNSYTAQPTFRSGVVVGAHQVFCTVTDAAGFTAVDALTISVGQPLNVDVTVDKQALVGGGGVSGQAQLFTTVYGGIAPYAYEWSVIDPNGNAALSYLSDPTIANPVFTSTLLAGTFRVSLKTTDSQGFVFVDSVTIVVSSTGGGAAGESLSLDVSIDQQTIRPGGNTALLEAAAIGGVAPLTFTWTATHQSGAPANDRLSSTTGAAVTFTSTATQGTYRLRCTVTDSLNNQFTDSVQLTVDDFFLIDLTAEYTYLAPGEAVGLNVDRTGGSTPFTYSWRCLDQNGAAAGSFTTGATGIGTAVQTAADDAANIWTAPGGGGIGSYRIAVTATDARGRSFTDSVIITVTHTFTLLLSATPIHVQPGGAIELFADRIGGTPPFALEWLCLNEADAPAGTFTDGAIGPGRATQSVGDDVANVWTAPPAATGTLGTYRFRVTATDANGATTIDYLQAVVLSPLSLNLTTNRAFVPPAVAITFDAAPTGGEAPYAYAWRATDANGNLAGTFTTGPTGTGLASQANQAGNAANGWSVGSEGSYTIICTVTDHVGQTFTHSAAVTVAGDNLFSLDLACDKLSIAPGETINLYADRTGGTANFTYAWSSLYESGLPAGVFGAVNQANLPDDSTNTWTAPATSGEVDGGYRISCLVTDALGRTCIDTIVVTIRTVLLEDIFTAPTAATTNSVINNRVLTPGLANGSDPGQQVTSGWTDPVHPRNLVITVTDGNNTIQSGRIRITGYNARWYTQSEIINVAASSGGGSTNVGTVPFIRIIRIDLYDFDMADGGDRIDIGVGNKFGLSGLLHLDSDVRFVLEGATVSTTYTLDLAAGRQGITFASAPNGARNYTVRFHTH